MKKMEELESGFEEMEGVKLGYLVIKGKQMFALSQVFTNLLKNIPRTTVHKRMDHLNVKKHHCDLEELRKLKAINSIAFHAAKCTLISREDVEALYFSCKTERVLKSHKRREKTDAPSLKKCRCTSCTCEESEFWKEKVWLSLHGVPHTLSFKNKGIQRDPALHTQLNLPRFYSKSFSRNHQSVTKSASIPFKNYKKEKIPDNYVTYHQKHTFIQQAVNRQPLFFQSAIAEHQGNADLPYKRRRKQDSATKQRWSRRRHGQPILVIPKCCKPNAYNGSFCRFQPLEPGIQLEPRRAETLQENYSSDSESSSISERLNNDSDFGSGFSTTSNSGTSDEEDDSLSDSSDVSSDEESSSQSDSSSVSSQVSIQSIRFRRARISSLNKKKPLLLQPTFHYRPKLLSIASNQGVTTTLDCERISNTQTLNFRDTDKSDDAANREKKICHVRTSFTYLRENEFTKSPPRLAFLTDPKITDTNRGEETAQSPNVYGNGSPQQRVAAPANSCQGLIPNWVSDKEKTPCKSSDSPLSLLANSKREVKISLKPPSPLNKIKTEAEETTGANAEAAAKTPPFLLNNVRIKVENTVDEYEYANQPLEFLCKEDAISHSFQELDYCKPTKSSVPKKSARTEESGGSLIVREYKNTARVRKHFKAMLWGRNGESERASAKSAVAADQSSGAKYRSAISTEDSVGGNKRKRTNASVGSLKKPFRFIANFPSPPSLVVGSDGDLSPAYSLNTLRSSQLPHRSHPLWGWQIGHVVPPPPNHKFRKSSVIP